MEKRKITSKINLISLGTVGLFLVFLMFPDSAKADDFVLSFDGAGNYVDCGNNGILNVGAGDFTLETWLKIAEELEHGGKLASKLDEIYQNGFELDIIDSGAPKLMLYSGGYAYGLIGGGANTADGQWHYLTALREGDLLKIYFDGELLISDVFGADNLNNDGSFRIGGFAGDYFKGMIDNMRIYSRALSDTEILEHFSGIFSNEADLAGSWRFNEGTDNNTADSSGRGNNGTISGATWIAREASLPSFQTPLIGAKNTSPEVKFGTKLSGKYRGIITFNYSVFDPDSGNAALKSQPMTFFYCDEMGKECQEVARDEIYTGSYNFDTTKVPDGNCKIRVVALDGYDFGDAFSETFSIDNTNPTFDISISPPSPVKDVDKIELKITASEEIKALPNLKITQQGGQPVTVEARGSGIEFSASYSVQRGYPGKAVISVSGEDLVGNRGEVITSGKSFFVERYGPPPPIIKEPLNNQIFTLPFINVFGNSQPNVKILLTLNGVTRFPVQTSDDGIFRINNVSLSAANKGQNTLSIVGVNEKGEESEEVVLKVKLNSPPKISITSSFEKIISGEKEINWVASDSNEDKLVFSIEYSNDGGVSWDFIASDLPGTSYKIDTAELGDGSNYLLRVTADDGTEKISSPSSNFTIKNNLPHLSLNISANYFTNNSSPVITGLVTSPENTILSVKYSLDQGETWKEALAADKNFNSLNEKFEISISPPLPDGKYPLLIKAEDVLNRSVKISRSFNVDTVPPASPIIELPQPEKPVDSSMDTNLELEGFQVIFQGKSEPKTKVELILENGNYKTETDKDGKFIIKDVNLKTHGFNNFSLSVSDLAGNTSQIKDKVILNNPPQLSVSNPEDGDFLGGTKEINWQAEDSDNDSLTSEILYQKKDEKWISVAGNLATLSKTPNVYKWDLSAIPKGDYKVKIVVGDGFNYAEKVINIIVDNVAPKGEFKILGPQLTNVTKPAFSGKANDDFSGIEYVEYSFNIVDWYKAIITSGYQELKADFKFQHRFPLADGSYKMRVRVTDRAGNITYLEAQNLTIDTTPPRIGTSLISAGSLILFPDEDGVIRLFGNTDYKILISVAGEAKEVNLKSQGIIFALNFNKATQLWESQFNFTAPGDYAIEITAHDEANNYQEREIANLKVLAPGFLYNQKDNQRIKGANITLYVFDESSNAWSVWDGGAFGQKNPQVTGQEGEYGFLAPPGKYKLKVSSRDFENVSSKELEAKKNSPISVNIPLTEKKGVFNKILNYFGEIIGGSEK